MNRLRNFLTRYDNLLLYIAKCVAGALLIHGLVVLFGYPGAYWCLISLVLVLTPDSNEAIPLALLRMKANLCGAAASLICMLLGTPVILTLCLALAITAVFCHLAKVMAGSRAAMAATIIVLQHEPGRHVWDTVLERIGAVLLGCLIAVLITIVFHRKLPKEIAIG